MSSKCINEFVGKNMISLTPVSYKIKIVLKMLNVVLQSMLSRLKNKPSAVKRSNFELFKNLSISCNLHIKIICNKSLFQIQHSHRNCNTDRFILLHSFGANDTATDRIHRLFGSSILSLLFYPYNFLWNLLSKNKQTFFLSYS